MEIIKGDLIALARQGKFDVIIHGVNCQNVQGAGIAKQMKKEFGTDTFILEGEKYKGSINKLGCIDYQQMYLEDTERWSRYPDENGKWVTAKVIVVNAYTQFNYGRNHSDGDEKPVDYEAITLCMRKINHRFNGLHIGLPMIGSGLAGGDWNKIKNIIKKELKDCKITIVKYLKC